MEKNKTSDDIIKELFKSLNIRVTQTKSTPNESDEICVLNASTTNHKPKKKKKHKSKERKSSRKSKQHSHSKKTKKKCVDKEAKLDKKFNVSKSNSPTQEYQSRSLSTSKSILQKIDITNNYEVNGSADMLYIKPNRSSSLSASKQLSGSSPSYSKNLEITRKTTHLKSPSPANIGRSSLSSSPKKEKKSALKLSIGRDLEDNISSKVIKKKSNSTFYDQLKKQSKKSTSSLPYRKSCSPVKDEPPFDPLDAWKNAKLASLRKHIKSSENLNKDKELPIVVDLLPEESDVKANSFGFIPLPSVSTPQVNNTADLINENKKVDLNSIPIPTTTMQTAVKSGLQSTKGCEKQKDEGKAMAIKIKDLKTSVVYQQAMEAQNKRSNTTNSDDEQSGNSTQTKVLDNNENYSQSSECAKEISLDNTLNDKTLKKDKKSDCKSQKTRKRSRSKSSESVSKYRKRSRDRSRHRSRSRRRSRSNHRSRSRRRSTSGSRSRDRRSRRHSDRRHSRSSKHSKHRKDRSRSSSRKRSDDDLDRLRDKASRKKLLEIARKNAVYFMKNECLPPGVEKESCKITGKSVAELTDFCKKLVTKEEYSDPELSDPVISDEDDDQPFASRHPFMVKDKPILMNIRNAPMLPTKTNAERLADQSKLREQFPVSSGSQHRTKESGWVPVEKEKKESKVFNEETQVSATKSLDIGSLVSNRLKAIRKLANNPTDSDAITELTSAQQYMQDWAVSKQPPGQFTGTTGARVMSFQELSAGHQAWARKEQFREANPVNSQFGLKMLQKMGWTPGEGLGKNKEGNLEPLLLDVKMDKKGLHSQEEVPTRKQPIPLAKNLSGKHPVSALVEICSKRKWPPPEFEIVFDCGPDHKKNFLMKAIVNGKEYKPSIATSTKKIAKANAAAACLQALGVIAKQPPPQPTTQLQMSIGEGLTIEEMQRQSVMQPCQTPMPRPPIFPPANPQFMQHPSSMGMYH